MGNHFSISRLPAEQQALVNKSIRSNRYRDLDIIMDELSDLGVGGFSRSALHRYLCVLREKDALCAQPEDGTIVTIVERGTGEVRVVKTSASGEAVAALIAGI